MINLYRNFYQFSLLAYDNKISVLGSKPGFEKAADLQREGSTKLEQENITEDEENLQKFKVTEILILKYVKNNGFKLLLFETY